MLNMFHDDIGIYERGERGEIAVTRNVEVVITHYCKSSTFASF
jgi:hypothetical protein